MARDSGWYVPDNLAVTNGFGPGFTVTTACLHPVYCLCKRPNRILQVLYLRFTFSFLAAAAWGCCFASFILPSLSAYPGHRQAPYHCKVSDEGLHFISHYLGGK
jgi:hypothetical protein